MPGLLRIFVNARRAVAINSWGVAGGTDPLLSSPLQGEGPDRDWLVLPFEGPRRPARASCNYKCDCPAPWCTRGEGTGASWRFIGFRRPTAFALMSRVVVIGIGNPDRGDDAFGRIVAGRLRDRLPRRVRLIEQGGEATTLLEELGDADGAILIDAAVSGGAPGDDSSLRRGARAAAGREVRPLHAWFRLGRGDRARPHPRAAAAPLHRLRCRGALVRAWRALSSEVLRAVDEVAARVVAEADQWSPTHARARHDDGPHAAGGRDRRGRKGAEGRQDLDLAGRAQPYVARSFRPSISSTRRPARWPRAPSSNAITSDDIHDPHAQDIVLKGVEVET